MSHAACSDYVLPCVLLFLLIVFFFSLNPRCGFVNVPCLGDRDDNAYMPQLDVVWRAAC